MATGRQFRAFLLSVLGVFSYYTLGLILSETILRLVRLVAQKVLLNSLIRKLFLWFQHNGTKEPYETNRIVCIGL